MRQIVISLILGMTLMMTGLSVSFAAEESTAGDPSSGAESSEAESSGAENGQEAGIVFMDVQEAGLYYYDPVYWAVEKDITTGVTPTEFAPDDPCTRGQMITFLWRAAGKPQITYDENPFQDVHEDDYFRDAVLWAVESGIAKGTGEDSFSPEEICTRAQCVTFLWRYFGSPQQGVSPDFEDVPADAYYADPVFWALKNGVTNGISETEFSPDRKCSRAQAMTFFYRAMKEKAKLEYLPEYQNLSSMTLTSDASGRTGAFTLKAENLSGLSEIKEVQAAVWTKENQGDIRWFSMKADEDGGVYSTVQNVSSFRRQFGEYHASLYVTRKAEDTVQLVHVLDLDFELQPDYYLYGENIGMGRMKVTVLGAGPDMSGLTITARKEGTDPEDAAVASAVKQADGAWTADVDWLAFMEGGRCCLELSGVSGQETSLILNTAVVNLPHVKKVIDVSQYQGAVDWSAAKKSGSFDGVILRCGLRGSSGKCAADKRFRENARACQSAGIPMGFYWYTSALTEKEAVEEADYCLRLIQDYPADYPVFIDTEWGKRSGLNSLSDAKRTSCIISFLDRIKDAGYETGIYASSDWFLEYMDFSRVSSERIWVASWSGRPYYPEEYAGWQYTAKGIIPGITQNTTDISYWFE